MLRWVAMMVMATLCLAGGMPPASADEVHVKGTALEVHTEGEVLEGAALVGSELDIGQTLKLRILSVRPDQDDPDIVLYVFETKDLTGKWGNPCAVDRNQREEGFLLAGSWDDYGRFDARSGKFSMACTAGAQAKCVRLGYKPWKRSWDGRSLQPVFEACVRMVRADYCGDGMSATQDGVPIAVYDDYRVRHTWLEGGFRLEAGWSPAGAVCAHHARAPNRLTLEQLAARCPRLRDALGKRCDEDFARSRGAILYNLSDTAR